MCSDSHGSADKLERVILSQPSAKHIIFLGDGVREIETLSLIYDDRTFHIVSGNCDLYSDYPYVNLVTIAEKRILFMHGHTSGVKHSLGAAVQEAKIVNADVLLYGHTHAAHTEYRDGLYIMNPGSVSRPRDSSRGSYGYIDIVDGKIFTATVSL